MATKSMKNAPTLKAAKPKKGAAKAPKADSLDSDGVKAEKARIAQEKADKAAAEKKAKDAAKAQAALEKEEITKKATKELAPHAKEVIVRLEKADKMSADADDHRVAAAIRLETARQVCETAGISFKKWSEENIPKYSYETVRKLVAAGGHMKDGGAEAVKLAISDMRLKNAEANKKLRETKKTKGASTSSAPKQLAGPGPAARADEALAALSDKARLETARSAAAKLGHAVVTQTEAKVLHQPSVAGMMDLFRKMAPTDQVKFVDQAAEEIGVSVVNPFDADSGADKGGVKLEVDADGEAELPDSLKR